MCYFSIINTNNFQNSYHDMRLLKYKVNKFRSVKNTEWIEMDQCSCFVGANESGKTNLLLPLWKFNPAAHATSIDPFSDYPRDEYSHYNEEEEFIEVLFHLTKEEQKDFQEQHDADLTPVESEEEKKQEETVEPQKRIKFTQ